MAMSSACWLVASRLNGLAMLEGPRTVAHGAGDVNVPGLVLLCLHPRRQTTGGLTLPLFS